jgi:hypothetical protein
VRLKVSGPASLLGRLRSIGRAGKQRSFHQLDAGVAAMMSFFPRGNCDFPPFARHFLDRHFLEEGD